MLPQGSILDSLDVPRTSMDLHGRPSMDARSSMDARTSMDANSDENLRKLAILGLPWDSTCVSCLTALFRASSHPSLALVSNRQAFIPPCIHFFHNPLTHF